MQQAQTVNIQLQPIQDFITIPLPDFMADAAAFSRRLSDLSADGYAPIAWLPGAVVLAKTIGLIQVSADISRVVLPVGGQLAAPTRGNGH